jgi:hypothetical protein
MVEGRSAALGVVRVAHFSLKTICSFDFPRKPFFIHIVFPCVRIAIILPRSGKCLFVSSRPNGRTYAFIGWLTVLSIKHR